MKDPDSDNNKKPNGKGIGPTRSFNGSVVVPGRQIGPFRIEQELGRGGAGVVYLAHDTKLDRSVAIKSLPPEVKDNPKALSRFTREARVLASLNHPNIATIYDELEEAEGLSYLVLEYIPGQTLAELIAKKPLKLEEALTIALQIAEAVAAAHEHDVIHRDLKPGNIKITKEGKVKVLDFGLAKVVGGEATDQQTTITEPGRVIGTPAYMSPEQARGKPTDKRSDIWSFGCILYEMLTATVPFKGETISDTLANILQTEPRWETLPENIPSNIRFLLRHCLEKEPRRRLRDIGDAAITIEDTTTELRRSTLPTKSVKVETAQPAKWSRRALPLFITVAAVTVLVLFAFIIGLKLDWPGEKQTRKPVSEPVVETIKAIVVLPFENLSGDAEQEYFVDGIRYVLGTELGKIRALTVKGQHSATLYKGTDKQTPDIARELGVDAVITGSVFKAANKVRITAQLIHGPTEENLWADSYEGDLADVLTLQREVALAIAKEIKVKLTPQEEERLVTARPINPQAHDAYLKGRFFWNKRSEEGLKAAISYFEQAKDIDPNYAQAYVGLADCYIMLAVWEFAPSQEVFPKAKREALQALAIDDTLGEAHNSLAYAIARYDWDWSKAEREFQRAIELNPHYATAHQWYAVFLGWMGRFDDALVENARAQDLEPLSLIVRNDIGWLLGLTGEHDESIEQLQEVLQMDPDFLPALLTLATTYVQKSMFEENITVFERVSMIRGRDAASVAWLAFANAAAGNTREAQTLLQEALERSKEELVPVFVVSLAYAYLGDMDNAFDWINKLMERQDHSAIMLKVNPALKPLRSDPRFNDVLKQMNFPETSDSGIAAKPSEVVQAPIEKIAVLPFTSISSEAGEEWFVDGMTDALITQLGKIKALTVISRTSAMQYKNVSKPMLEIAQDLGVDALIEGSVTHVGDDVQITARLIDGRTDKHIWGDFFQGTFSNILALQSEVTLAIAKEIEVVLTPEEETRIAHTESVNPEVHEAYLKGNFFWNKRTEDGSKTAIRYFEQAIEQDPSYALAHAGLADCYIVLGFHAYLEPNEAFPKAKREAQKALSIDNTLAEAHTSLAYISTVYEWDWESAESEFKRAIDLNPNYATAHHWYSTFLHSMGRYDEAIVEIKQAQKLDPVSNMINTDVGEVYHSMHQYDQAIDAFQNVLAMDKGFWRAHWGLAKVYLQKQMFEKALAEIQKAKGLLTGWQPWIEWSKGIIYARMGKREDAQQVLNNLLERSKREYVPPIIFADLHFALDENDKGFDWLNKAHKQHDPILTFLKARPIYDSVRSDPRFTEILKKMRLDK